MSRNKTIGPSQAVPQPKQNSLRSFGGDVAGSHPKRTLNSGTIVIAGGQSLAPSMNEAPVPESGIALPTSPRVLMSPATMGCSGSGAAPSNNCSVGLSPTAYALAAEDFDFHSAFLMGSTELLSRSADKTCCCCEPCQTAPEPVSYFDPAPLECPCPRRKSEPDKLIDRIDVGVFLDGWPTPKGPTMMKYMCQRYHGMTIYREGVFWPPALEDMVEKLKDELQGGACFLQGFPHPGDNELQFCAQYNIDIFGFSRGGYSALLLADRLREPFDCVKCGGLKAPFDDGLRVRFLGVLEPARWFPFSLKSPQNVIPPNVDDYWLAYVQEESDLDDKSVQSYWLDSPFDEIFPGISHGDAGKVNSEPQRVLIQEFNDRMIAAKYDIRIEPDALKSKEGKCGG